MSYQKKPKLVGVATGAESIAFKQQLQIGKGISQMLAPCVKMSHREIGKQLGISHGLVQRTEAIALFKLSQALKKLDRELREAL
jgi:hypothetical protein